MNDLCTGMHLYADKDERCGISITGGIGALKLVYQDNELLGLGIPELCVDYVNNAVKLVSRASIPLSFKLSSRLF